MGFEPNVEGLVAVASGVALIALGALLLLLRPRLTENLVFGAAAMLWGTQVTFANLGRLTDDAALHATFARANLLLLLPTAYFVAYFACLHPQRNRLARSPWGPVVLGLLVVPGLLAFLVEPSLITA